MTKRLFVQSICLAAMTVSAISQTGNKKDSLLKGLVTAKEDTAKIRLLLNIEKLYSSKNYDSFYYYLDQANTLAKKLKTEKFDFFINAGFSEYFYYQNDYKNAVKHALHSRDVAEKENDLKLLAKSYNNLAAVYNHFGNKKEAINCILKSLDLSERTKDSISFPVRHLTASATYYNLEQFDKAIIHARKAVEYGKHFANSFAIAMGLNNLAASYSQLNILDSAISIGKKQLDFAKKEADADNINNALINLCYDNFKNGNIREVAFYSNELKKISVTQQDKKNTPELNVSYALNFMAQENYINAKIQLDSAIQIANKDGNADALRNAYQTYSIFYYLQGKIKAGETYTFKYDSLVRATNLKELNFYTEELETKYDVEKKVSQIKLQQVELKQKSILNYLLAGAAFCAILIGLLGYKSYKNKQKLQQAKINELETEKQLTATEAVLKGEEQERTRLAKDLHDGLGGMLSGIKYSFQNMKENLILTPDNARAFERSIDMLDSSIKEMRRVAHNMMPETLVKYGLDTALKEFCNEIDRSGIICASYQSLGMDNALFEQTVAVTIYRVVQELVNNVVKHAAAKNVLVQAQLTEQGKLLTITVEDDGKGFDTDELTQAKGIGWNNIQNRVEFLNGNLDIRSTVNNGTSVLIEISI
ncbi:tetratricopeptide repeat-containing sensor histidine kinase [Niabella beijingensis]|uniref:tetratricopeptide repeat-containing sensor histidine kinase n=1 Tax=Niabella beijingensis TaxID=2872700 RepID=UPI001CBC4B70|nr:sensor histidine kinase [Niabella beijingensis]MBZ4191583.1 sensor histidine kinase [Niabella beijingensis]